MGKKVKRSKKSNPSGYVLLFTGSITFKSNGKIIEIDGIGTVGEEFGEDVRITIQHPKNVLFKIGKNKLK